LSPRGRVVSHAEPVGSASDDAEEEIVLVTPECDEPGTCVDLEEVDAVVITFSDAGVEAVFVESLCRPNNAPIAIPVEKMKENNVCIRKVYDTGSVLIYYLV
jgi:hypothetical protein